ncbi:hypothetical protein KX729_01210 [Rhizobium sp. XQZ8]|uniref:hypothetical protein n=1 Tax=Rhizobium populisoli TaxID=2859785 RepID=UPI001CA5AEAD|nr:hypothetical protein [Rhizobium populisoli]MBW6420057.1 hypothetical protein [Rhizobium populisoli]
MPVFELPKIITHNHHPDGVLLANVCDLPLADAEKVMSRQRAATGRPLKANYLQRRFETEAWLIDARKHLLGPTPRHRPIYFFLGDFTDNSDPERPCSLVMPLDAFPPDVLTFTFPDSMASFAFGTLDKHAHERRPYHGRVFTLREIVDVVREFGFPDRNVDTDRFIEVQVWDDKPVLDFIERDFPSAAPTGNPA